jgi:hypothetical protein
MSTYTQRPYENIERLSQGTPRNNGTDPNQNGLYIDLPFLNGRYDWYALMSNPAARDVYDTETASVVARNHLPESGSVKPHHVYNRMSVLGLLDEGDNYKETKRCLDLDRHGITTTVTMWLRTFIIYCANNNGITIHNREIRSWSDFLEWIERFIKTSEDAMKFYRTVFVSFEYEKRFRVHITCAIMYQSNFTIMRSDDGNTRNFCEKIITHRINQIRKQTNDLCAKHSGYSFRIIRPPRKPGDPELPKAVPKFFFEWQLQYSKKKKVKPSSGAKRRAVTRRTLCTYGIKDANRTREDILSDIAELDDERIILLAELDEFDGNSKFIYIFFLLL